MKLSKLATWAFVFGLALPVCAAQQPGAISGYVRNASGTPQMGAVVQILGSAHHTFTVFTDESGFYTAKGLLPGLYTLKVTAPSFLPTLREKVGLGPGASLSVNITLSTLLGIMQLGPVRPVPDDDDWKWTLRSVANRPILRVFDDPPVPSEKQNHDMRGTLSFVAGSVGAGYGAGSDMSTGFSLERSIFSDGHLAVSGTVGYGTSLPAAVRAYQVHPPHGRRIYSNGRADGAPLRAIRSQFAQRSLASACALGWRPVDVWRCPRTEVRQRTADRSVPRTLERVSSLWFADFHLSPDTVLEYQYTTSRPDLRNEKGFDSAPADLSESNPRVSLSRLCSPNGERTSSGNQRFSHRIGNSSFQVAYFSDRIVNPALTGTGEVTLCRRIPAAGPVIREPSATAGPNLTPAACALFCSASSRRI